MFGNTDHTAKGKSVFGDVISEIHPIVAAHSSFGAKPHIPVRILKDARELHLRQPVACRKIAVSIIAGIAGLSLHRPEPAQNDSNQYQDTYSQNFRRIELFT